MARDISIGSQSFEDMRTCGFFYVDKTYFVRDWWHAGDPVTLICRPRRFGKTLALQTVECLLSTQYAGRGEELFGGLAAWDDPEMRGVQGTVPVIALSFARCKGATLDDCLASIRQVIRVAVYDHRYLRDSPAMTADDLALLARVSDDMDTPTATSCIGQLCRMLEAHHHVRPVVLLDEYDCPMQEAWAGGFWDDMVAFMRVFMNATFKTNPSLGRGLITGVTRVSRESVFSDLNNLSVVTTSTPLYQTAFGFTQDEVDASLDEFGLGGERQGVREWYDGFVFDGIEDIYNPWSITHFLRYATYDAYWANTSGNALVSSVIRRGGTQLKQDFETLLSGGEVEKVIDEQVVFSELYRRPNAVWALLLAAGYVKVLGKVPRNIVETPRRLALTNREVRVSFDRMVDGWFAEAEDDWDDLSRALLAGDVRLATCCLSDVALYCMSSFDGGRRTAESEPERFYHGLVLGLLAHLRGRYSVESNRESGYGRYDVALVPTDGSAGTDPAVVMEFKVFDPEGERSLADTVARARAQIEERAYVAGLVARGIAAERIRTYGIAFRGKEVLVG